MTCPRKPLARAESPSAPCAVDDEATALVLETLFDIKVVVHELRDELLGGDDEEEEDARSARPSGRAARTSIVASSRRSSAYRARAEEARREAS